MKTKFRFLVTAFGLLACLASAFGQEGNSWINYSQPYVKVKTGSDNIFRIDYDALIEIGFPVDKLDVSRLQMFHRGEQVAIHVEDGGDGSFDSGEYLDFYGRRNDGVGDVELFVQPRNQIHQFYNLFSDTTAFFLTIGDVGTGRRMALFDEPETGLTAKASHDQELLNVYTSEFSFGQYYPEGNPNAEVKKSKYDRGQMFMGDTIMINEFTLRSGKTFRDFIVDDLVLSEQSEGKKPSIEVQLVGFNNRSHRAAVKVGPNTDNLRTVKDDIFFVLNNDAMANTQVEWTDVSAQGRMIVRVEALEVNDEPDNRFAVSYLRVTFPQEIDQQSADEKIYYINAPSSGASNQLLNIENVLGQVAVYDVTDYRNPLRISSVANGNDVRAVVSTSTDETKKILVKTTSSITSLDPESVTFRHADVSNKNYILISHPYLRNCSGALGSITSEECLYEDPVQAYIDYRSSIEGGGFNVLYADVNELMDEFNYGEFSPLAIRRFSRYVYENGNPEYMFLVGRSRRVDNQAQRLADPLALSLKDLVPTMGAPGSDILFTEGLDGTDHFPTFPVGRLSVSQPWNVGYYLEKVMEKESTLKDSPWTKNFIQLSGGLNTRELLRFKEIIEGFKNKVVGDFLGANVNNISKQTNNAIQKFNISEEVNRGVGFVTFFGHSSSNFTDIDIGSVTDPANGYDNAGRYPVFLVNGCRGGEIFFRSSFGENWMAARNKGAVNYMAHSDVGLTSILSQYSNEVYELLADTLWMTRSIGHIQQEAIRNFLDRPFIDESYEATAEQTVLQGDPAIPIFGHDKVDYIVRPEDISVVSSDGSDVTASTPFFRLAVVVSNGGRTTTSPLSVRVNRRLEDGSVFNLPTVEVPPISFQDTIFYDISNQGIDAFGQNTFEVILDADNTVDEGSEINNTAERAFNFPATGTFNTSPTNFSLVNEVNQQLVVQSSNLRLNDKRFVVELDTVNTFDSNWRQRQTLEGKGIGTWNVALLPETFRDTVQYYWRSVFEEDLTLEDVPWNNSTFTYIRNGEIGWGQTAFDQFEELALSSLQKNEVDQNWVFAGTRTLIEVVTFGADHPDGNRASAIVLDIDGIQQIPDNPCNLGTLNAIAFDKDSGRPYFVLSTPGLQDISDPLKCGRPVSVINSFRDLAMTDVNIPISESLTREYINGVRADDFVLLFSVGTLAYPDWRPDVFTDWADIGLGRPVLQGVQTGEPLIVFGRKGAPEGSAVDIQGEKSASEDNARSTRITFNTSIAASIDSGTVETPVIGPSSDWGRMTKRIFEEGSEDEVTFEVRGIALDGTVTVLFPDVTLNELDLSGVDPLQYPYIRLYVNMEDRTSATPAQLDEWTVTYQGVPEGIVSLQNDQNQNISLQEGEPFLAQFKFTNISAYDFSGPLNVRYTFTNQVTGQEEMSTVQIPAVAAGQEGLFELPIATQGRVGLNDLEVFVNPGDQLEQFYNNNVIRLESFFNVLRDEVNPNVDVTFDGIYILDGDIVSPKPLISMELRDNNPYLFKTDGSDVVIKLGKPCDGCELETIDMTSNLIEITPASESTNFRIDFRPDFGAEPDGVYQLQVEVPDASGNQSGIGPYVVNFEVVSESAITNFYPYPNPFSTSTRFVFTLTGEVIPDQIKIQIFTVSGKVVREITQEEIGPIRIGNNITEYAWDGKDEFGDKLAIGTYLYRVQIRSSSGSEFGHRGTGTDQAFNKQGFGKLVIIR
ncbi:MAG: hypothetical protein HEP71_20445 [Roseivirga sp.]|nr:hypothetical protein [Roseivirga sp.]